MLIILIILINVILVQKLISALGEVMGRQFSNQEATDLHQMIGWSSGQILTYREWCGLCGAAERLLGRFIFLCKLYTLLGFKIVQDIIFVFIYFYFIALK